MFIDYINGQGDRAISVKYGVPYTSVRSLLTNPKYCGYMRYNVHSDNPELVKTDLIEPIVNEEIFNKAQEVRKSRNKNKEYMTLKKRPLTSKIICGCCKKKFNYKDREVQWVCASKSRREGCNMPIFNSKKLIAYLEKVLNDNSYINAIEYTIYTKLKGLETLDKSKLEKNVRELEVKKSKLLDVYLDGIIDKETFDNKNGKINIEIETIKQEINNIVNHNQYIEELKKIEKIYKKRIVELRKILKRKDYDKLFGEIENVYVKKMVSAKGFSAEVDYVVFKEMELLNFNLSEYNYNEYLNREEYKEYFN